VVFCQPGASRTSTRKAVELLKADYPDRDTAAEADRGRD